jgi:4-carboxymuconolactone decarboxylase
MHAPEPSLYGAVMGTFPIEEWESNALDVADRFYATGRSPMAANGMASLDPELAALIQVIARGRSYADPTVDLKTRALCTMACLVGLGEQRYIETWIANSLTAGATVEEIASLMSQLFVYIGTPKSVTSFDALQAVIDRRKESA